MIRDIEISKRINAQLKQTANAAINAAALETFILSDSSGRLPPRTSTRSHSMALNSAPSTALSKRSQQSSRN